MRKVSRIATLLVISIMMLSIIQIQPMNYGQNTDMKQTMPYPDHIIAVFDSQNITVEDISPANGSLVSGSLGIDFNLTSDYGPLNLTLFVDDEIYPDYNLTVVGTGVQTATVDTTTLFEGLSNFTLFFEYIHNVTYDRESIYLNFIVDNDGESITSDVITPLNGSRLSGLVPMELNISSNYGPLNLTIFVDGEILSSYSQYLIGTGHQVIGIDTNNLREGLLNFTLQFWYNSSGTYDSKSYFLEYIVDNDGVPITVLLVTPTLGSTISGNATITIDVGSEYIPLSATLYIDGTTGTIDGLSVNNGLIDFEVDTSSLLEGSHNFTFMFEFNSSISQRLVLDFVVDNHGFPDIAIISPAEDGIFTGIDDMTVNITSTYAQVYANVSVDGAITPEYNQTLVNSGVLVMTFNGSRYENGLHTIEIIVWTEEDVLYQATDTREFNFLDYIRFDIVGVSQFTRIAGNQEIGIRVATPYATATLDVFEDGVPILELTDVSLAEGNNNIILNVTDTSEGDHNYTFIVSDDFGHSWTFTIPLIVDNHGVPTARFVSPTDDIVIGVVEFTVDIDTTWDELTMSVYVDDVLIEGLEDITVYDGENSFILDVSTFSKWQHKITLEFETPENETTSIEEIFGFASIRIEEVASLAILLAIGFLIPIIRWRQGQPIRPILILDLIFLGFAAGLFLIIGVSSVSTAIWHFNLTSIWTIGGLLVFCNWVYPLLSSLGEED